MYQLPLFPRVDGRARVGLHTFAWVLVAAQLYDLDQAVKERAKRGEV